MFRIHAKYAAFVSLKQQIVEITVTENSGDDLEANELIVLKQFHKRKRKHREVVGFTEYRRPVSQRRQNPVYRHIYSCYNYIHIPYVINFNDKCGKYSQNNAEPTFSLPIFKNAKFDLIGIWKCQLATPDIIMVPIEYVYY